MAENRHCMLFEDFEQERRFRAAWEAVRIERSVHYGLFTFGDSELPYFLVTRAARPGDPVSIRRGEVKVTRPSIITPGTERPEFRNFFESAEEHQYIEFLLARTAAFSNLQLSNHSGPAKIVTDTVDEAVSRLSRQLDDAEEEHVAILSAPSNLEGMAVLRYASERVISSAPGNVQELRERGFLP